MDKLYTHSEEVHNMKSPFAVVPIIMSLLNPKSVLDVGCGTGTWLKVFNEFHNINDILGLDGSYLDKNQLVIDSKYFKEIDLRAGFNLQRSFDVLICLEVAEHLPEESADNFVDSLCKHADNIIFSAAIPGQGGQNHINEQWPEYWAKKFEEHGYYFHDLIRPYIWNDERVDWWYKQNIFYINKKNDPKPYYTSLVHPELFKQLDTNFNEYKRMINEGYFGLRNGFKIFINSLLYSLKSKK